MTPRTPQRVRRPNRLLRALFRAPVHLYDRHAGWILGNRFLCLTHIGRRTGRTHRTVIEVLHTNPRTGEVVVMAGFGHTTDWLRNIQAAPPVEITHNRRRFAPTHRVLDPDEAATVLAAYEHQHRLLAPVLRRVLSRLSGATYDSTPAARHHLVRKLPLIAFRPTS